MIDVGFALTVAVGGTATFVHEYATVTDDDALAMTARCWDVGFGVQTCEDVVTTLALIVYVPAATLTGPVDPVTAWE